MRIYELVSESKAQISEGPVLDKIGQGLRGAAKAVGAVPGVVSGLGQSVKKGYAAGKAFGSGSDSQSSRDTYSSKSYSSGEVIRMISDMEPTEKNQLISKIQSLPNSVAFDQMAKQLSPNPVSSTGGSIATKPGVVRHTAKKQPAAQPTTQAVRQQPTQIPQKKQTAALLQPSAKKKPKVSAAV